METVTHPTTSGKTLLWIGRILTGLLVAFFLFDGIGKVMMIEPVKQACAELGIPEHMVPGIGIALIVSTLLYAIPQTAILGAILLTGYMGGAIMTHVRMGGPAFNIVFGVIFGVLVWDGVYLREPRLRAIAPWRR